MKTKELKVAFQPSGRNVYVLPGTTILEAAGRAGIILQTPCGGNGTCGKCRVKIVSGQCHPSKAAVQTLSEEQLQQGFRLACQTHVENHLSIEIPRESRFEARGQILTGDTGETVSLRPVVCKRFFDLDSPSRQDAVSDVARLKSAVGDVKIPFQLLRKIPGFLRAHDWQGTAVLVSDRLIGLEIGDTSDTAYGVAVDLGTTTIVGTLFDLVTGEERALASLMNPQVGFGDDVISRISRVREDHGALSQIQHTVLKAFNALIQELTGQAGVASRHIYEIVIAGNSTMQQMFCGLDTSALGEMPFVQVFDSSLSISAATLGIAANPGAEIFVFPQIGSFVGGDTVSGMLAARMDETGKPTLLVDIGTNGEIVLSHNGRLQATSTAAGPAFEGARIVQGMRATAGAIEKVVIRDDVIFNVIGNAAPAGLCGTALIDAAAELLRRGIIGETGRICSAGEAPADLSEQLRSRLIAINGETNFLLVRAEETSSREPIYLWQKDVRELQLATGAIRAGINILLRRSGLEPDDLDAVLLAGAFGNFIRRSNARRIGLLPQISCSRIRFIGNAASLGAKLALLSADERERASRLQKTVEHVDLSLDPEFQMEFATAMIFPTRDVDSCLSEVTEESPG